jgi:hypothetical protein
LSGRSMPRSGQACTNSVPTRGLPNTSSSLGAARALRRPHRPHDRSARRSSSLLNEPAFRGDPSFPWGQTRWEWL